MTEDIGEKRGRRAKVEIEMHFQFYFMWSCKAEVLFSDLKDGGYENTLEVVKDYYEITRLIIKVPVFSAYE